MSRDDYFSALLLNRKYDEFSDKFVVQHEIVHASQSATWFNCSEPLALWHMFRLRKKLIRFWIRACCARRQACLLSLSLHFFSWFLYISRLAYLHANVLYFNQTERVFGTFKVEIVQNYTRCECDEIEFLRMLLLYYKIAIYEQPNFKRCAISFSLDGLPRSELFTKSLQMQRITGFW